ncbi:OsmC family protein [Pseudomonas sp. QL9]|uniref:OsmC family protein n=1 Tax=Pseudomonas sp. QL9 TaxID=3242725 RepID=UPI00352A51AF
MESEQLATALQRLQTVLERRPAYGRVLDEPAMARWQGAGRVSTRHANGTELHTDLPAELGGSGTQVSPGWLLRAALAGCVTTRIAMLAASAGIELDRLEVEAHSQSDLNGLLGLADENGQLPSAGPVTARVQVRIAASGVPAERLRQLVEQGQALSPVSGALAHHVPLSLDIQVADS